MSGNDSENKFYIGDGVYVSNDGWHLVLETHRENGMNRIYLEPDLLARLLQYAMRIGFDVRVPDALAKKPAGGE